LVGWEVRWGTGARAMARNGNEEEKRKVLKWDKEINEHVPM
jgi:hypothetical protein